MPNFKIIVLLVLENIFLSFTNTIFGYSDDLGHVAMIIVIKYVPSSQVGATYNLAVIDQAVPEKKIS